MRRPITLGFGGARRFIWWRTFSWGLQPRWTRPCKDQWYTNVITWWRFWIEW